MEPSTRANLEKEARALVKLVLSFMEEAAALPPEKAAEPIQFNERRRIVMRKIWNLYKRCVNYDPRNNE